LLGKIPIRELETYAQAQMNANGGIGTSTLEVDGSQDLLIERTKSAEKARSGV
jgi:hypothetical protein